MKSLPNLYQPSIWSRGRVAGVSVTAALAIVFAQTSFGFNSGSGNDNGQSSQAAQPKLTENERILHVLNRLGFGARPDDIAKVKQIGLKAYIDQQLYPEKIDDSAVDRKLQSYPELQMSDSDIEAKYKEFITVDQTASKLRQQARRMEAQKAAQTTGQTAPLTGAATPPAANPVQANADAMRNMMASDPDLARQVQDMRQQMVKVSEPIGLLHEEFVASKLIRAVESQRQLQEVLVDFWSNHFNIDIRKAPCGVLKVIDDRNVIRPHVFGKFRDLLEASAKSPAMLVYLDNFQSVADQLSAPAARRRRRSNSGPIIVEDGNKVIYLPGSTASTTSAPAAATPKRKIGLNENYAREIMELHTLGVNGGYTQQDVHEVARCFTGWSIGSPDGLKPRINRYGEAGEFRFYPRVHDEGEKNVLGHRIPAGGGMRDGEIVLDLLASDPATRKHISYELCQRLVCDEPPFQLVNKCIETWQHTDGDLREIVRTIVTSPEFFSSVAMRKKIKSPFEYAVSSVRALDGTLDPDALISRKQMAKEANSLIRPPQGGGFLDVNTNTLLGQITTMGEPLFQYLAPTGFPEDSRKWVSSGALISRLNFSLALTQGKIKDVKLEDPAEDAGANMDPNVMIDRISNRILHGEISPSTRATLVREAQPDGSSKMGRGVTPATIAALLLGSPEFQRR